MMDRDLPKVPAAIFLAAFVLSVFIYIVQTPYISTSLVSQVVADADGTLWAVYRNRLIEVKHPAQIADGRVLSMQHHDIESHAGNLVALRDGSWLINRGGQSNDLWSDIKVFLRIAEPDVKEGESSLLRCDAMLSVCKSWGDSTLQFDRVWSGYETFNGQIIINDVARHQIHLVSATGQLLDTLTDFRFPNQTSRHGQGLWVTDTNRGQLTQITVSDNSLKKTGEILIVDDLTGIANSHRLPGRIAGDQHTWWVLLHNNNMANGGIYRIDSEQHKAERFGRDVRDAVDMIFHEERLYLTDFASNSVWSIDPQTGEARKILVPNLEIAIEKDQLRAGKLEEYTWWTIGKVMLVGVIFLGFAIKKSKAVPLRFNRVKAGRIDFDEVTPSAHEGTGDLRWITKNTKAVKFVTYSVAGIVLLFFGSVLLSIFLIWKAVGPNEIKDNTDFFLVVLGASFVVLAMLGMFVPRAMNIARSRLGVFGNQLVFCSRIGQDIPIKLEELIYTDYGFYTRESGYVQVQNEQRAFYDKAEFTKYALPLVQQGKKVSVASLYLKRLKDVDKLAWLETVMLAIVVGAMIARYWIAD